MGVWVRMKDTRSFLVPRVLTSSSLVVTEINADGNILVD